MTAAWRQTGALPEPEATPGPPLACGPAGPAIARTPLAPETHWGRRSRSRRVRGRLRRPRAGRRWRGVALRRRLLLLLLVIVPSLAAPWVMLDVLPYGGDTPLEVAIALLFGALLGWVSLGFWTALFGFAVLVRGGDRFQVALPHDEAPAPDVRTAILVPLYNEPVDRVFANLRAMRASLRREGAVDRFDFFVLSDSDDPGIVVSEELAWAEWCRAEGGAGGIYYRHRRVRRKRKSGNVADFLRRWGRRYPYLVVLDADSLVSGSALVRLVAAMERRPEVAILQTTPAVFNARTLLGRVQQFGNRLCGPLFAAGMHFWHLGDGPYWGHNAIVRTEAFMAHALLPRLRGSPPLGGDILSHDFVEAALLGRAGWEVWIAYDLPGSWEETPGTLLGEMQRDRRWCQGNLQHLRLLLTDGLCAPHRALFLNGIFSYVSALLWLAFLGAGTAEAAWSAIRPPDYFPEAHALFPRWPVWHPAWALGLVAFTAAMLVVPKALGVLLVGVRGRAALYGGVPRLVASACGELVASALLSPIRMVFHCRFVLATLVGRSVGWRTSRADAETGWREALRRHGADTAVACGWAALVYALRPELFLWLAPVVGALALSVPLSVLGSRRSWGQAARARGLFLTPEEVAQPPEQRSARRERARLRRRGSGDGADLRHVVRDARANAVHCGVARPRRRPGTSALQRRALLEGPEGLSAGEWLRLLDDGVAMRELHEALWRAEAPEVAARWGVPRPGAAEGPDRAPAP